MTRFLLRRLVVAVPVLIAVSLVIFTILHLAPGGPLAVYAQGQNVDPADLERLARDLGLDQPLPVQYARWFTGMLRGRWGLSYREARPVTEVVGERLLPTLELMGASVVLALLFALLLGTLSATHRTRPVQYTTSIVSMLGVSIPTFWLGLVIILVFAVKFGLVPTGGRATLGVPFSVTDRLWHLVAPAMVLATLNIAGWSRYIRSSLLEVLEQDFIRTAYAKGLPRARVIVKHALRNALLPLITLLGLESSRLVGGAMVTEVVFSWPGIGRLLTSSLLERDYPVLMGCFMLMAVMVVIGNLLADICYGVADPRIHQ